MKQTVITLLFSCLLMFANKCFAAYLENVPYSIRQPNGIMIDCFVTGDEYYRWVHDEDGFTIVQNATTGYYCYAVYQNDKLVASRYVVGESNPLLSGLVPGTNLTSAQILNLRNEVIDNAPQKPVLKTGAQIQAAQAATSGTINNIVIYIRFSDQTEFPANQSYYTSLFNSSATGVSSMYNYFKEVSYNQLNIISYFCPARPYNDGRTIISYQDPYPRSYYCEYSFDNPEGYNNDTERKIREHNLLANAILNLRKEALDFDNDNDGYVDNICFIIRGGTSAWSTLLWPHKWSLDSRSIYINSTKVWDYNVQLEDYIINGRTGGAGVLCHELFHTIGAPDLYRYSDRSITPVGTWDLMASHTRIPQSMGVYMKFKYGRWVSSFPYITEPGRYYLNSISSPTNNCYRIATSKPSEYIVLEFRQRTGTFESELPHTALLIYRVNIAAKGSAKGPPDEIYVYRLDGTISSNGDIRKAALDPYIESSSFHNKSNPNSFLSDGSLANIFIKNVYVDGNSVSFDVRFCNGEDVKYTNTSLLPRFTNATNKIETSGSVIVKNTDNVKFEAGKEIILNAGFEIKTGGVFEITMDGCGK